MNFVELLSPAGDAKSFKAAILAGANAIFFGVENFNARQRAENISFENLSDLIKLAKSKNVKSYLTLNTLVYDSEFSLLICLYPPCYRPFLSHVVRQFNTNEVL